MLQILKASAGSGKTTRLTKEYIHLLFENEENYKHILAITFTHKATEEMKSRIISQLDEMAIKERDEKKKEKAKRLLSTILNDYDRFHIYTIDRFFQSVIRSFVREVGLQHGYGVELDEEEVLQQAVDRMIMDLNKNESASTLQHLLAFSQSQVEEGENWNVRNKILPLASELNKEIYKVYSSQLLERMEDKDFLPQYIQTLRSILYKKKQRLKDLGEKGLSILQQVGWDINSDRGWKKVFIKAQDGDFLSATDNQLKKLNDASLWETKSMKADQKMAIKEALNKGFETIAHDLYNELTHVEDAVTASLILKQIHVLGLLTDIDAKKNELGRENNRFLITDTTHFLAQITQGSDVPFIYEKTGVRIDYYMLDEFQDTSRLQWRNLSPLLHDCLDEGKMSLVVGDVKQSIYRWRNSDSELLGGEIEKEFKGYEQNVETLGENRRSLPSLVEFNNDFFIRLSQHIQQELSQDMFGRPQDFLSHTYSREGIEQTPYPNEQEGWVRISFVTEEENEDEESPALKELKNTIDEVLNRGYRYADIAILVRRKEEAQWVVNALSYPFVSDEALLLSNATSVQTIIATLRYLLNGNEELFALSVGKELAQEKKEEILSLLHFPLFELCEGIVRIFGLGESEEGMYIANFMDYIVDYINTTDASLSGFMDWWEKYGEKISLSSPSGGDAIHILTIHKSKGLGFPIVILPFCNWDFKPSPYHNIFLWCKTDVEPFSQLPILPIRFEKSMQKSYFKEAYEKEIQQTLTDNLNLLYVAFTRPRNELHVIVPEKGKKNSSTNAGTLLRAIAPKGENVWERGYPTKREHPHKEAQTSPFAPYRMEQQTNRLLTKVHAEDFWEGNSSINYGNLMHNILGRIEKREDIEHSLLLSLCKGEIGQAEKERLQGELERWLSFSKETEKWFDGTYRVLKERSILRPKEDTLRPDRIMIGEKRIVIVDYKFGMQMTNSYLKQVREYMKFISQMDFQLPVEGYVWYVELGEIIQV